MSVSFDSRSEEFRRPFGAVAAGTTVYFRIRLPRCWGCHAAALVVRQDGCFDRVMGMFWAGICLLYTSPSPRDHG